MNIRQILVPVDGSELSLKAADAAASLAQRFNASVTLLTAVEPLEASLEYVSPAALEEVARGIWQASEAMLDQAAARIRPQQSQVEKRVVEGTPATAIAAEANAGYDLIVMGSRGLGMFPADRHLLGSVAERVIQKARCPVLIVPSHGDE